MTRVITVGYSSDAFVEGGKAIAAFPSALTREDLERLVDLAKATDEEGHELLVVYPAWSAEPTLQRLQTVRSALDTQRVAAYASSATPLAGAVLVSLAAALGAIEPSAGGLVGAMPRLERQLVTVTWLSRLSGLTEPNPTVWEHAVSLLPWTAFVVSSWPEPAIHRLGKDVTVPVPTPRGKVGVAIAQQDADMDWVRESVVRKLRQPVVTEVEPSPLARRWWGTGKLAECVLYPLDIEATAAAVSKGLTLRPCQWCGHEVAASPCAYCGLELEVPTDEHAA